MSDLFDYLKWRGDLSFDSNKFNQVDALVFATISYIDYSELLSSRLLNSISFDEVAEKLSARKDFEKRKNIGAMINPKVVELFLTAAKTSRFKNVQVYKYESIYDEKKCEQFAAVTFVVGDTAYVTFRGTDDTFVGWKEDFNIVCVDKIPSRVDAMRYLKEVAADFPGKLGLIGHSKGGYLAVDSGALCGSEIQGRISNIYNFDGPGFSKEYLASKEFRGIEPVLKSFYPHFSVVGMIFNHNDNYEIVKSSGMAANQHDPLSWHILGCNFENTEDFSDESEYFSKALNEWVSRLDQNSRETMVSALFGIVEASGCKTNLELEKNKLTASGKMIQAFANLDKNTKKEVHLIIKVLKQSLKSGIPFINAMDSKVQDFMDKISEVQNTIAEAQK